MEIDLKKVPQTTLITCLNYIQELIKSKKFKEHLYLLSCSLMEFPEITKELKPNL
uniref:Uncharacterized protein n=1 Tax=Rhizophagus irregularis (strain DAOM 181602 / DAOM 197198 / MUCL 43194) TaxID=747089 RepID=U9T1R3_RHIID